MKRRRLLIFGLAAVLAYWGAYAYRMAVPGLYDRGGVFKGADYEHFYVLGHIALRHQPELLYDEQAQLAIGTELFGPRRDAGFGTPAYGPQVSLLFAPLALLPYRLSLTIWWGVTFAIYFSGIFWLLRHAPGVRSRAGLPLAVTLAMAFPGFQAAITWGQITAIGLLCFLLATGALRANRRFALGLALGGLFYKPPLGILAAVVLLARREWAAVAGALLCCAGQLALAVMYYGDVHIVGEYAASLARLLSDSRANEPVPEHMHSLRALWMLLVGRTELALWLYVASALAITAVVVRSWKTKGFEPLTWCAFIVASILVDPHVTIYDLVVLAPIFILAPEWALARRDSRQARLLPLLLAAAFITPFLGATFTTISRVQLSALAFIGLVIVLTQYSTSAATSSRVTARVIG